MEDTGLAVNPHSKWQSVLRVVSISGGVVAVNEPGPNVQIRAGKRGNTIHTLQISSYESLFQALQEKGFHLIGSTFVVNQSELEGLQRPLFWVFSPSKGWLAWDVKQKWRQIAVAAGKTHQMPLMDTASRIASGLTYTESRLLDLATAYSIQLGAHLHESDAKEYEAFKDTNSFAVYKAINALFWEMAVLRDTLAEFAAVFCFSLVGIRTMRGLRKSLATAPSGDSLADEILRATDQSSRGWLARFTSYRNCFTHQSSLEQVAGPAFAIQDMVNLPCSLPMPQIYYPLPQDIDKLSNARSLGLPFNSLEELRRAVLRRHERASEPDALDYLHSCVNEFAELSLKLVARSPIPPQPIRIGPEDMIGEVRIKPSTPE